MKRLKTVFLATALMTVSGLAHADFLIEPHIGYNVSSSGESTFAGVKTDYEYSGPQFGLRAGGQYLGFMAGLDYTFATADIESKESGVTYKDEFNKKELGVFVGYNLPILFRAWAGYYFDAKARDNDNSGSSVSGSEYSGSATELGVGFTGLPFLSLNLMYRMINYDEFKSGGVTTKLSGDSEVSISEIVLGVSLPLTL